MLELTLLITRQQTYPEWSTSLEKIFIMTSQLLPDGKAFYSLKTNRSFSAMWSCLALSSSSRLSFLDVFLWSSLDFFPSLALTSLDFLSLLWLAVWLTTVLSVDNLSFLLSFFSFLGELLPLWLETLPGCSLLSGTSDGSLDFSRLEYWRWR